MDHQDCARPASGRVAVWDERFRRGDHAGGEPDGFLWSVRSHLNGVRALDLACGAGRHAVALAKLGYLTTAVDFSAEALRLTAERADAEGVSVETQQLDLESDPPPDLGAAEFDLVAVFQFLHRPLFPAIREAVTRGGLVVYKTYLSGLETKAYLLEPNELLAQFPGWRVLRYEEELDGRATAALLAQKPE